MGPLPNLGADLWGLVVMKRPLGLWAAHRSTAGVASGINIAGVYALAASVWTVWLWMAGFAMCLRPRQACSRSCCQSSAALVSVFVLDEPLGELAELALGIALLSVVLATLPPRR